MAQRTIVVDWDSLEDLRRLVNMAKSRFGELTGKAGGMTKKERAAKQFDLCNRIFAADIAGIYAGLSLCPDRKYYVYAHTDPTLQLLVKKYGVHAFAASIGMRHRPFYIGKGTGERGEELDRNGSHRKVRQRLRSIGLEVVPVRLFEGLTELEALCAESKLIDIFGIDGKNGILKNLDEGVSAAERREIYREDFQALCGINRAANTFHAKAT